MKQVRMEGRRGKGMGGQGRKWEEEVKERRVDDTNKQTCVNY